MPDHDDGPKPIAGMLHQVAVNLWPEAAVNKVWAKLDEVYSVVDRADARLAEVDTDQLSSDLGLLSETGIEVFDRIIVAVEAIFDARAILAEAIPPEEEGDEEGEGDG